jgi:hypothetical protein
MRGYAIDLAHNHSVIHRKDALQAARVILANDQVIKPHKPTGCASQMNILL